MILKNLNAFYLPLWGLSEDRLREGGGFLAAMGIGMIEGKEFLYQDFNFY